MKLHSHRIGEGTPFLILHGFLGTGDNWKTIGKKIAAQGYEVHLIDQRNHGRSNHSLHFNYELMASDLKEYCEDHKLRTITLLGHSMGGKTVMLFATQYPEIVNKLIVADIAPKYYPLHHQDILDGLSALDFETITSRGEADQELSTYISDMGIRMFLLKNLYWKEKGVLGLRINLEVLIQNIIEIGRALPEQYRYEGETLFLKGSRSKYITDDDVSLISQHFPKAILREISNAGHWLHAENPDDFLRETMRFLSK